MRGKKAKTLRRIARTVLKGEQAETVYTDVPQQCRRPDADGVLRTVVIYRTQMMKCQRSLYQTIKRHAKQNPMHG